MILVLTWAPAGALCMLMYLLLYNSNRKICWGYSDSVSCYMGAVFGYMIVPLLLVLILQEVFSK